MRAPADVSVEFDHNSAAYAANWREIYKDLRQTCPVARTEAHGGFYVLTKYADVARVLKDDATFASLHEQTADTIFGGITIPPAPQISCPIEMDPPTFTPMRRMLNPSFSPGQADKWRQFTQEVAAAMIDNVIETGRIDFINDLASPVPAIFTAALFGLNMKDWRAYADAAHGVVYTVPGTPEFEAAGTKLFEMIISAVMVSHERRAEPKDDLLSAIVQYRDTEGEALSDEIIGQIATVIITGGADTTTGLVGNALKWLGENPDKRDWLREDFSRLKPACEEFLRYFTPTQGLARTVTRDVEIGGLHLTRGDRVFMSFASANHDPDQFENPEEIILDRTPNRHQAFGLGLHRCIGSNFTRMEFEVMLAEVLTRLPDYVIDEAGCEKYENIGIVNGWHAIPATFTPGPKVGSPFHF